MMKNSELLKELKRRIKNKQIRLNYDGCRYGECVGSIISGTATDEYFLNFDELEVSEENKKKTKLRTKKKKSNL